MMETAYDAHLGVHAERRHEYGQNVHIVGDTFSLSMLGRLCSAETTQPEFNRLVASLYQHLFIRLVNVLLPSEVRTIDTRMKELDPAGTFKGRVLKQDTQLVVVDVARAGILPSQVCFDLANTLLDPNLVRQDHLVMARTANEAGEVTGASILSEKVGGPVDGRWLVFPDPMGATGGSLAAAIEHYREEYGQPAKIAVMCLMITPQFLKTFRERHPDVEVFALRLDRGRSTAEALASRMGTHADQESGLTDIDYIVPGGGGFGELMNNSWV